MPEYPGLECYFCESRDIKLPIVGIAFGIGGDDYSFCEECLKGMSADEFWKKILEKETGFSYPPGLAEHAIKRLEKELNKEDELEIPDYAIPKKLSREEKERRKMSNALRWKILIRDKSRCVLCGTRAEESKLHIDHIIPISKGGKTEEANLRTLCEPCNLGKGNKAEDG